MEKYYKNPIRNALFLIWMKIKCRWEGINNKISFFFRLIFKNHEKKGEILMKAFNKKHLNWIQSLEKAMKGSKKHQYYCDSDLKIEIEEFDESNLNHYELEFKKMLDFIEDLNEQYRQWKTTRGKGTPKREPRLTCNKK